MIAALQSRDLRGAAERRCYLLEQIDDAREQYAAQLATLSAAAGEPVELHAQWEADCDGYYLVWTVRGHASCVWGEASEPELAVQRAIEVLS